MKQERDTKFKDALTLEELRGCTYLVSGYMRTVAGRVVHTTEILPLVFTLMNESVQHAQLEAALVEIERLGKQKCDVIKALGASAWGDVIPAINDLRDP